MHRNNRYRYLAVACVAIAYSACKIPNVVQRTENKAVPVSFNNSRDTANNAKMTWQQYFTDPYLIAMIDTALKNNQELNITMQEIEISRNEIRARKGEYLPFVGLKGGAGVDKAGRYTSKGASEANIPIAPGRETPEPLPDYMAAAYARREVDIFHKLRNAKKSAIANYLSSVEGKNFAVTNLIAEIANSYYELLALDNQLSILKQNIELQTNALEIVRLQKQAARVTELAVRKFEAEVYKTTSLQFDIQQKITETENRLNYLMGRYPQPVGRNDLALSAFIPAALHAGLPSQLLANRPDIRQAEQKLAATKLNVKVAKAEFYPSLSISAAIGYQAFNPSYLLTTPASLLYSLAGELVAPMVNRNAIKATYYNANAKQVQAAYDYERTILNAYVEVANQLSKISNLEKSYNLRDKQVQALTQSITISNDLFRSTRADYMEVLLTQRDALESKFELIETKKQQMNTVVNIYQALGGGWN